MFVEILEGNPTLVPVFISKSGNCNYCLCPQKIGANDIHTYDDFGVGSCRNKDFGIYPVFRALGGTIMKKFGIEKKDFNCWLDLRDDQTHLPNTMKVLIFLLDLVAPSFNK